MTDDHDHDHDHDAHVHEQMFEGASLVSARLCLKCGSYVSGLKLAEHAKFHEELGVARNRELSPEEKSSKKSKKK